MQKARSFENLIRDHEISADEFFQSPGITNQIRNNLTKFTQYIRTHRQFAERTIKLALNISYEQLDNLPIKTASHNINEVLGNEDKDLFDLFFQPKSNANRQQIDIPQELEEGIQSEAEKLFRMDDEQTLPPEQSRQVQISGQELFKLTFLILKNPLPNETCLGHIQKIYSFFIRHDSYRVLQFFERNQEQREIFLNNLQYSSISSLVAQLLTSQDKTKLYKFQQLKRKMLEKSIQNLFKNLQDSNFFDGIMIFIEEILNSTKQSYYEYFEDFKRVANYLVSNSVLERFFNELFKLNEKSFTNVSRFLQCLFVRINNDQQDAPYYQQTKSQPTMNFQIKLFIQNYWKLLDLLEQISSYNILTKISYVSFLHALSNVDIVQRQPLSLLHPSFLKVIDIYSKEPKGGIFKNKIYSLINNTFSKASKQQTDQFLASLPNFFSEYFSHLKTVNNANNKIYHKNQNVAFDIGIISQLTRKDDVIISNVTTVTGKDFKRITKKFQTKIANFLTNPLFEQQDQSIFMQNYALNKTQPQNSNGASTGILSLNFVGKNNTPVPFLQLPQKYNQNKQSEKEEDSSQDFSIKKLADLAQRQVFEQEQVIVLTHSLELSSKGSLQQGKLIDSLELHAKQFGQKINVSPQKQEEPVQKPAEQPVQIITVAKKLEKQPCKLEDSQQKVRFYTRHLAIFV